MPRASAEAEAVPPQLDETNERSRGRSPPQLSPRADGAGGAPGSDDSNDDDALFSSAQSHKTLTSSVGSLGSVNSGRSIASLNSSEDDGFDTVDGSARSASSLIDRLSAVYEPRRSDDDALHEPFLAPPGAAEDARRQRYLTHERLCGSLGILGLGALLLWRMILVNLDHSQHCIGCGSGSGGSEAAG